MSAGKVGFEIPLRILAIINVEHPVDLVRTPSRGLNLLSAASNTNGQRSRNSFAEDFSYEDGLPSFSKGRSSKSCSLDYQVPCSISSDSRLEGPKVSVSNHSQRKGIMEIHF